MNDASAWIDSIRIKKNTKTRNELDFFKKQSERAQGTGTAAPRREEKLEKSSILPGLPGFLPQDGARAARSFTE